MTHDLDHDLRTLAPADPLASGRTNGLSDRALEDRFRDLRSPREAGGRHRVAGGPGRTRRVVGGRGRTRRVAASLAVLLVLLVLLSLGAL